MGRTKKYLIVFTKMGLFSAILFGFLMSLKMGILYGMIAGLLFGLAFSLIMASILIPIDYLSTRRYSKAGLNVRQNRVIRVRGDIEYIFEKSMDILKGLKFIKTLTPQKERMHISARTKLSLASFGEDIRIQFKCLKNSMTEIHIRSQSHGRFTMIDFGKNFRNVEHIRERMAQLV